LGCQGIFWYFYFILKKKFRWSFRVYLSGSLLYYKRGESARSRACVCL